jgi:hypothetical protein
MKILFAILFTFQANASITQDPKEVSSGGNVIVCFKKDYAKEAFELVNASHDKHIPNSIFEKDWIDSVEMYDLFEAKLPRGIDARVPDIIDIAPHETLEGYIDARLSRFTNFIQPIEKAFVEGRKLIPNASIRFSNGALVQNNDIGGIQLIDKSRCLIQTMAAQKYGTNTIELYVDSRLFNHEKHSKLSRATLFIHEYIYAYSKMYLRHRNSSAARKIVEMIISHNPELTIGDILTTSFELGYLEQEEFRRYPNISIGSTRKTYPLWTNILKKIELPVHYYIPSVGFDSFLLELNKTLKENGYETFSKDSPLQDIEQLFIKEELTKPFLRPFWPMIIVFREERADYIRDIVAQDLMAIDSILETSHHLIDGPVRESIKGSSEKMMNLFIEMLNTIKDTGYYPSSNNLILFMQGGEYHYKEFFSKKLSEFIELGDLLEKPIPYGG